MPRKSPRRHSVKTHQRKTKSGRTSVRAFVRGSGTTPIKKQKILKTFLTLKYPDKILHPKETTKIIKRLQNKFGNDITKLSSSTRFRDYFMRAQKQMDIHDYVTIDFNFGGGSISVNPFAKEPWQNFLQIQVKRYYSAPDTTIIGGKVVRFKTTKVKKVKTRKIYAKKLDKLDMISSDMINIYENEIKKMYKKDG